MPLTISFYNRKKIVRDFKNGNRSYVQIWIIWLLEVLYHQVFAEVGRSGGNFGWGVRIGNYLVTLVSVRLFLCNAIESVNKKKNGEEIGAWNRSYLYIISFVMIWEFGCGIYYFCQLLTGRGYGF